MKIELKITLKIPNKLKDVNSIEEFVFRERNKIGKMIKVGSGAVEKNIEIIIGKIKNRG